MGDEGLGSSEFRFFFYFTYPIREANFKWICESCCERSEQKLIRRRMTCKRKEFVVNIRKTEYNTHVNLNFRGWITRFIKELEDIT